MTLNPCLEPRVAFLLLILLTFIPLEHALFLHLVIYQSIGLLGVDVNHVIELETEAA